MDGQVRLGGGEEAARRSDPGDEAVGVEGAGGVARLVGGHPAPAAEQGQRLPRLHLVTVVAVADRSALDAPASVGT